jgi:hypothetical protein
MHRPTFSRTQRRTSSRSGGAARAGALENRLARHWSSRNRTRGCSPLSGWRSWPNRRLIDRTRSGVRHDHARRRRLRTRWRNGSRWFRCHRSRWLWRRSRRSHHRSWSRSLSHRRRRSRQMGGTRRSWHRWGCPRGRWWLSNWWRWSRECRPNSRRRHDNPRARNRRRSGRRWRRSFHCRDRRCCG